MYKIAIFFLSITIAAVLLVYLATQIIIFIGGGNFNAGFLIVTGIEDFHTGASNINVGNAMSALIPLVTSVSSFVVGCFLYVTGTETAGVVKKKQTQQKLGLEKKKAQQKLELEKRICTARSNLNSELCKLWAMYCDEQIMPESTDDAILLISKGFLEKRNDAILKQYKNLRESIANEAKAAIFSLTQTAASHVAVPENVRLGINEDENDILEAISNANNNTLPEPEISQVHNITKPKMRLQRGV
jgi:hypothetical protein